MEKAQVCFEQGAHVDSPNSLDVIALSEIELFLIGGGVGEIAVG